MRSDRLAQRAPGGPRSERDQASKPLSFPRLGLWTWAAVLLTLSTAACSGEGARRAGDSSSPAVRSEAALEAPDDVVLITIDTLRADALGFAGNARVETPVLDALASSGRVFSSAYAHNVVTLPSHANMLTGLYPYQHGVRENSGFVLGTDHPTLATILGDAGFATGAFVAAFPLDSRFGLDRGFDHYDDHYPKGGPSRQLVMPSRRGDEVVSAALEWWRDQEGQRRFLWVHLYDPHAPYAPPEPFASRYAGEPYLGEVAATDHFLEPLLRPILDGGGPPTLVVMTADHGESLGEHGELTHGLFAYEATLKVPLVLWGRGVEAGVDARVVGHVDLLPTVLDSVGIAPPPGLPGHSLLRAEAPERPLYFEALSAFFNRGWAPLHGVLAGALKLIHLPLPELYDVAEDPAERNNLAGRERGAFRSLRAELPEEAIRRPERQAVSTEEARQLAALGYLGGSAPAKERFTADDDPKNLVHLDRLMHEVFELRARGELAPAETKARELVAARPTMAIGWEYLATVLRELGRLEEAVVTLREAMAQGTDHPAVIRQLGLALAEIGEGSEAVAVLEPLAGGGDLDTLNALGVAYFAAGKQGEARRVLERVLARDSRDAKALETLGGVELADGDARRAREHLERAVDLNPELPVAWNSLGVARQWSGDTPGALAAWQQAVAIEPTMFDALYNLGLTAAAAGELELARRALGRYLESAPASRFAAERERARQALTALGQG